MDVKANKMSKAVGLSLSEKEKENENEGQLVLEIHSEASSKETKDENGYSVPQKPKIDSQRQEPTDFAQLSLEMSQFTPSANKPPKIPSFNETLYRKKSLSRSVFSKPKSRFGEQPYHIDPDFYEENNSLLREQIAAGSSNRHSFNRASPGNRSASSVFTPRTQAAEEFDDEEIYKKVQLSREKHKKLKIKTLIGRLVVLCIIGCLVASLTVNRLSNSYLWGLEIWKWWLLATVISCGMMLTNWVMHVIVFLIERNFLLKKKVLYFVHGLKKSVQVTIWLMVVLLTWVLLFDRGDCKIMRSKTAKKILDAVTWTLLSLLTGAILWLIKTLLLKILASKFHMNQFFDRIQEAIFHQYVLQMLSGPPLMEDAKRIAYSGNAGQVSFRSKKTETKVIDMGKLHQMKREKVSAWTMKVLVDAVTGSELSTISRTLDESYHNRGAEVADSEITNEMEAIAAAYKIFNNVALPGNKYIEEEDLLRFMIKEEVDLVLPLFDGGETRQFNKKALTNWVVKVYQGRKMLAHALKDTKTAVKQLNNLVAVLLIIVTAIVWLLLMEIASTKVLVFLLSQLALAVFMFGNTCKTTFEALIFVFVMHPFDVGDRCVVDGVQVLVEEMNILTTVFLKLSNEKVYYPNSVLATKPISNYYRSPDMSDTVEFSISFMTPLERIGAMKEKIKRYLEKNPQHWHPNHNVVVKEIEDVNKIKFALYVNHTMNFQEWGEKNRRRTELVMELKKIFEELNIKYNLLPQTVHLFPFESETSAATHKKF